MTTYIVPLFGMGFVAFYFYLLYKEKKLKYEERLALIEKGMDPALAESQSKREPKTMSQPNNLKNGLLCIGVGAGLLAGYGMNVIWGVPVFIAVFSMILLICGILYIYFYKTKIQ